MWKVYFTLFQNMSSIEFTSKLETCICVLLDLNKSDNYFPLHHKGKRVYHLQIPFFLYICCTVEASMAYTYASVPYARSMALLPTGQEQSKRPQSTQENASKWPVIGQSFAPCRGKLCTCSCHTNSWKTWMSAGKSTKQKKARL